MTKSFSNGYFNSSISYLCTDMVHQRVAAGILASGNTEPEEAEKTQW